MESTEISSSSRVKGIYEVEYTDPSGIFPLISNDLNAKLPLRNLHWNSPSRPLRSIDSLYIEFVPDEKNASSFEQRPLSSAGIGQIQPGSQAPGTVSDVKSPDSVPPRKERRHQIPGLRQTPYLKIYLLRCDDSDTYKASTRKLLRDWIKDHTPPSQSSSSINNQENHDAFEWLIIHVVLPDVQGNLSWPNRASSSVLEKVRSDFNSSSKAAADRVVQLPVIRKTQPQAQDVPPTPGIGRDGFLREASQAWEDLLAKLKSLILTSFDLRVRQYEEDIKEKGAQRSLPGWNFCTFFVLKEGLARGFESVGLVEDALMGYDELSVELYNAIREEKEKASTGQQTGLFKDFTQELLDEAKAAMARVTERPKRDGAGRPSISVLDADRKPYRELILANDISAFEFQGYLFARQISLLSRIARSPRLTGLYDTKSPNVASGARTDSETGKDPDDLMVLAEICRRGIRFITSAGSVMREDLGSSLRSEQDVEDARFSTTYLNVIENIVASWTFTSSKQVLSKTDATSLSRQIQALVEAPKLLSGVSKPESPSPSVQPLQPLERPYLPTRTTSLLGRTPPVTASLDHDGFSEDLAFSQRSPYHSEAQTGLKNLAAQRAEMFLVARRALSGLGSRRGWKTGPSLLISGSNEEHLEDVSLEDDVGQDTAAGDKGTPLHDDPTTLSGLYDDSMRDALSSHDEFYLLFESLTSASFYLYKISDDQRSIEAMAADSAIVKFHLEDYATCAGYLHQLAPSYARDDWSDLEIYILDMYARSLQKLDRMDEYIGIALKLLAKIVHQKRHTIGVKKARKGISNNESVIDRGSIEFTKHMQDVLKASAALQEPITASMDQYFTDISTDPYIRHDPGGDGFKLTFSLRHSLPGEFIAQRIKMRIASTVDGQRREIWLSSKEPATMRLGLVKLVVFSNVVVPDWYTIEQITIHSENIIFIHDLSVPEGATFFGGSQSPNTDRSVISSSSRVLVWPQQNSFEINVLLNPEIHLDKPRSIILELCNGTNAVSTGKASIKPASAGLRLHTGEAQWLDGDSKILDKSQPGIVSFAELPSTEKIRIKIPYKLETDIKEIRVRAEVTYTTVHGDFVYGDVHTLPALLPLGVNVQDIFKQNALFSKFAISSSTSVPLRLLDCRLEGTDDFGAASPKMDANGLSVFTKQPASMVYRISQKQRDRPIDKEIQARLLMHIKYICLDEEILTAVQNRLVESLKNTEFQNFSRLLVHLLSTTLIDNLSIHELESVSLLREVNIGTFEDFRWERVSNGIARDKRDKLVQWLKEWHKVGFPPMRRQVSLTFTKQHPVIHLSSSQSSLHPRTITIPVDVPQMHIVHIARIDLLRSDLGTGAESTPASLGRGIPAELVLKYTRRWDSRRGRSEDDSDGLSFYYELDADTDTWLIGGQRRTFYTAKENEKLRFRILLLPQKSGLLPYPTIDIRSVVDPSRKEAGRDSPSTGPDEAMSSEIENQNQGESIHVIPDLISTSVAVDPEGPAVWLVESRARQLIDHN